MSNVLFSDKKSDITKYMITWKPVTCGFRGDEKTLADIDPTGATSHVSVGFGCEITDLV